MVLFALPGWTCVRVIKTLKIHPIRPPVRRHRNDVIHVWIHCNYLFVFGLLMNVYFVLSRHEERGNGGNERDYIFGYLLFCLRVRYRPMWIRCDAMRNSEPRVNDNNDWDLWRWRYISCHSSNSVRFCHPLNDYVCPVPPPVHPLLVNSTHTYERTNANFSLCSLKCCSCSNINHRINFSN